MALPTNTKTMRLRALRAKSMALADEYGRQMSRAIDAERDWFLGQVSRSLTSKEFEAKPRGARWQVGRRPFMRSIKKRFYGYRRIDGSKVRGLYDVFIENIIEAKTEVFKDNFQRQAAFYEMDKKPSQAKIREAQGLLLFGATLSELVRRLLDDLFRKVRAIITWRLERETTLKKALTAADKDLSSRFEALKKRALSLLHDEVILTIDFVDDCLFRKEG